jgi:hypothetical protein
MNLDAVFGPRTRKFWKYFLYAGVVIFVAIDFFIERHHPHFAWDNMPGFNAIYGLVGSSIVIVFAKLVVGWFIYRKEEHYDK